MLRPYKPRTAFIALVEVDYTTASGLIAQHNENYPPCFAYIVATHGCLDIRDGDLVHLAQIGCYDTFETEEGETYHVVHESMIDFVIEEAKSGELRAAIASD